MPTQSATPPVIFRSGHFSNENSPCYNGTENYDLLLSFHKIGDSPFDSKVSEMVNSYMDNYPSNGTPIIVTKTYEYIEPFCNYDCTKKLLQFTLDGDHLKIEAIDYPTDKVISIYTVSLIKGLIQLINKPPRPDTSLVEFEFTGGIAEYRIGSDDPVTKAAVLMAVSIKNNLGIKKHLGVYDMSIPPEYRKN